MDFSFLAKSRFKGAMQLTARTGISQLVALAASPLITRLYQPAEFGEFAIYGALLSILTVVVCLRFEVAIVLPDDDRMADSVLAVSVLAVLAVTLCVLLVVVFARNPLADVLGLSGSPGLLLALPVSLFLVGLMQAGGYWLTRQRDYIRLGNAKIAQSLPQTLTQIALGALSAGSGGLVAADIVGKAGGNLTLWWHARRRIRALFSDLRGIDIRQAARRYQRLSTTSIGASLVNEVGSMSPTLLLANFFGPTTAGVYALVQRVLALPMDLIGRSVGSVFLGEAAILNRERPDQLRHLYLKYARTLFALGLLPAAILVVAGKPLFSWVFGSAWAESGQYAQILAIAFLFRFAISPLGQILYVIERADLQIIWDISRTILLVAALIIPYKLGLPAADALVAYAGAIVVVQVLYVVMALAHLPREPR